MERPTLVRVQLRPVSRPRARTIVGARAICVQRLCLPAIVPADRVVNMNRRRADDLARICMNWCTEGFRKAPPWAGRACGESRVHAFRD